MKTLINPYYSPEKLDLTLISYDQPGLCYEYNTLCYWATKDGRVFSAEDSGCSCPTPFEGYEGEDQKAVLQQLEQVGSPDQAVRIAKCWGHCSQGELDEIETWVKTMLAGSTSNFQI